MSRGEAGWIDTDYCCLIHVRDFVKKTNDNPHWDVRHESSRACPRKAPLQPPPHWFRIALPPSHETNSEA
jgi:hypothetical protein